MSRSTGRERAQYLAARLLAHLPDMLKIKLSGEPPIVVDRQQLDPQLQVLRIATRGRRVLGLIEPTIAAGRDRYHHQTQAFRGPVTTVAAVRDVEVDGAGGRLRARHYVPPSPRGAPLMVYFHGGGFVIGDLDTHDEPCRLLCRHAGMPIVSVAYRLAPGHAFPAAGGGAVGAVSWGGAPAGGVRGPPPGGAIGGGRGGGDLRAAVSGGPGPARN